MKIEERMASSICGPEMRVRITTELRGSIDGIQLSRLMKGQIYDVNTPLACYLLSEAVAELALDFELAPVRSVATRVLERLKETRRKIVVMPRALAADRARRKKRKAR